MKLLQVLNNQVLTESISKSNPCDSFSLGKQFCNKISKILDKGQGGKNAKVLKQKAVEIFQEIRQGDYTSMGEKVELKPGNPQFDERVNKLKKLMYILWENDSCSNIVERVQKDIDNVSTKGLKMIVDDDQAYSLLNRINTHHSVQAFVLTHLALMENKHTSHKFYKMDQLSEQEIIDEMLELLSDPSSIEMIDKKISELLNDPDNQSAIMQSIDYSRTAGEKIEQGAINVLKEMGYKVIPFSGDFGFVDYFGIDFIAIDENGAYPVQASSSIKYNPKIFEFRAPDCKCFALFKSKDGYVKYEPLK